MVINPQSIYPLTYNCDLAAPEQVRESNFERYDMRADIYVSGEKNSLLYSHLYK